MPIHPSSRHYDLLQLMTYCKISLREVTGTAKYPDYQNSAFTKLFTSLRVKPTLGLTRSAFKRESVRFTKGLSISGVQQKLSMTINAKHEIVPVSIGGRYILKPSPEEYPHAAENEHTAMLSGRLLGISTADCGLLNFKDGELVYITRRFDRTDGTDGDSKLHQEDLLQGFGMESGSKYERSHEEAGAVILEMTSGRKTVVLDYLQRIMHAYLIGNDDMHLKNTSLQKDAGNSTRFYDRLTPNYDCLFASTFENRNIDGFLALDFFADGSSTQFEEYGFYTGHDFLELARRFGISEKPVRSFVGEIEAKMPELLAMIDHSYMPDAMKVAARDQVVDRLGALQVGL